MRGSLQDENNIDKLLQRAGVGIPTLAKYLHESNKEGLAAIQRVASGEESVFQDTPESVLC